MGRDDCWGTSPEERSKGRAPRIGQRVGRSGVDEEKQPTCYPLSRSAGKTTKDFAGKVDYL
jgi:hypothetical protein